MLVLFMSTSLAVRGVREGLAYVATTRTPASTAT
jgi:hypothetical protein